MNNDNNIQPKSFFSDENSDPLDRKSKNEPISWQVSYRVEINFLQTQKLLAYLFQQKRPSFQTKELMNVLGYSDKKTKGFVRLLYYMGLLEEKTRKPMALANLISKYDVYFEDIGTLWFLHYHISSQPNLIVWNRVANHLMTHKNLTIEDAALLFDDIKLTHSEYSFTHHLRKEFIVFVRAYLESEFSKLNILTLVNHDSYIRTKPTAVPDEILMTAILFYKQLFFSSAVTLEVKALINPQNSPGRLFYLDDVKFRENLERLRIADYITIESFADLDQIKFIKTTNYLECLEMYYQKKYGSV